MLKKKSYYHPVADGINFKVFQHPKNSLMIGRV